MYFFFTEVNIWGGIIKLLNNVLGPTLKNFIFTHDQYIDADVIFRKKESGLGNISLMDVTPTHVCFCVTDTDVDVYEILR